MDPAFTKSRPKGGLDVDGPTGPVPEDNLPGHHPAHDQDKPEVPPAQRHRAEEAMSAPVRFGFRFDPLLAPAARLLGIHRGNAFVEVDADELRIRFGRWNLHTSIDNIAECRITGPYQWFKVAGPPHISLSDRGVTFATSTKAGACIRFRRSVPAALPFGLIRHPAATVTVEDPDGLAQLLERAQTL